MFLEFIPKAASSQKEVVINLWLVIHLLCEQSVSIKRQSITA
jgi:hypothetical protein